MNTNKQSTISVIIPTVNAHEELDLALSSIKKNSDHRVELVVVVDPDQRTNEINKDILVVCKKHKITPFINKENQGPYGSWNRGAQVATTNWLVFATDDQYFAPHWDSALMQSWQPKRLVAGQLVGPGIIPVYKTNIKADFGANPKEFKESDFVAWCAMRKAAGYTRGRFFIPLLQARSDYDALGHYPTVGKFGTSSAPSNDYHYIEQALKKGYEFGTAQNSYSYHFQASSWKKKTLSPTITAVVLTKNEESDLEKCLASLKWVSEIIVIDAGSNDQTLKIAKKHKATIYEHEFQTFATQRNFGLAKASSANWVLMVDADEVVEVELANELQSFARDIYLDGVYLPRKNYIFGRWIEHADWYPDHRLVFVRPGLVTYEGDVHERIKFIRGNESTAIAKNNLIHHNYDTVHEFVQKNLVDYPLVYASVLDSGNVKFNAFDLLSKPIGEFMRRFFLTQGYKDGLYGLILAGLMGVQTLVSYCYLWEMQGKRAELTTKEAEQVFAKLRGKGDELRFWLATLAVDSSRGASKLIHRARRKALTLMKGL